MVTGYLSPIYAESLAEFGTPYRLSKSGGWILKRPIFNLSYLDGMGCYPFFDCQDWSKLHLDLNNLADELISLAVVSDPFGNYDREYLERCFTDVCFPYKQHFVTDLSESPETFISSHHLKYVNKSLNKIGVEICESPTDFLNDWIELYGNLVKKHNIKGMSAFSRQSFTQQFLVPGIVVFRAYYQNQTIGMILCYVQGENVYCHLGSYNALGYKYMASYAIVWTIIQHFADRGLKYVNIGAGAGIKGNAADGLNKFKQGWSNCTRTAYFCGRIFDRDKYADILRVKEIPKTDYFPAYRQGEFG